MDEASSLNASYPEKTYGCRFCEIAWGTLGLTAGCILIFIGLDLISGGALTRTLTKGVRNA